MNLDFPGEKPHDRDKPELPCKEDAMRIRARSRRRGVVLILFALSAVVIFAFIGLAFDLGRLYIVRNEAQGYCDAAALAAASMLDGTMAGINAARNAAQTGQYFYSSGAWKGYHFQNTSFQNVTVEFATQYTASDPSTGDWTPSPSTGAGYRFVRVTASGQVPMYLSPILTGQSTGTATASAVAAQVKMSTIDQGLVPFAPLAHCTTASVPGLPACSETDNFGYVEGLLYTLRWGANTFQQTFKNNQLQSAELANWCSGDVAANNGQYPSQLLAVWIYNSQLLQNKTGFWSSDEVAGNANNYARMILGWQGEPVDVSENLPGFDTSPPQISAIAKALEDRGKMGDPGNVVYTPIVDPVTGEVLGFYCFRILTSYSPNGNSNWCAEFLGGCVHGSGRDSVNQDGVYEIRLVR
jgi:Flp pilus assembly protein TadG